MDYAALRDGTVVPLIQKFGTPVTYRDYTDNFDASTGLNNRTYTDVPSFAIIEEYKFSLVNGQLIKHGDRHLLMAGISEPILGDEIQIGTDWWTVVAVLAATMPGGIAVCYEIQVHK